MRLARKGGQKTVKKNQAMSQREKLDRKGGKKIAIKEKGSEEAT